MVESARNVYSTEYIEETAAYCRVSTTEQKLHGLSLDSQRQKLETFAKENNLKIVEWYVDEGVSGRKPIAKRPEMQRMLNDAAAGKFRRIIFIKIDRYFRSLAEYHISQQILDAAGVVWTATEEKYDLSTANGRAFVNMKLTIAELEADTAGERVKIVNEYKIREGIPLTGSHNYPFCYAVGEPKEGERHKYVVKQEEEVMEDLIAHVMVNQSVRGAMLYINRKHNRNYSYGRVMKALTNEMICGSYKGNPNYCKPFITREMFDRLQEIIKRNPRTAEVEHCYRFTGLIRCPECGRRLAGTCHHIKRGERRYKYYGYRCNNAKVNKACSFITTIFENTIERMLLAELEGIIERQEIESIEIREKAENVSKYDVEELQAELDRLNYSWQKGRIKDVAEYDRKYDKLIEQIEAANAEQAELNDTPDYERIKSVLTAGWKEIYNELDDEHRRAFWRSFIDEIHVNWTKSTKEIIDIDFF